jgi:hypothetical protein
MSAATLQESKKIVPPKEYIPASEEKLSLGSFTVIYLIEKIFDFAN